jgi:hypothetical protein
MARIALATRSSIGAAVYVPLLVRLSNDADGDGSYSDSEASPLPRADVPFQVRLENAGGTELAILAIRDVSPTPFQPPADRTCADLVGDRLAPGQIVTCRFTAEDYAPPVGERAVNTFEVDVVKTADPSNVGTVTDITVVRTAGEAVLGLTIGGGGSSLATTGAEIATLLAAALALGAVGLWLTRLGNRRETRIGDPARQWIDWVIVPPPSTRSSRKNTTAWPGETARWGIRNSTRAPSSPRGVTTAGASSPRYRILTPASNGPFGRSGIQLTRSARSPRRARRLAGPTTTRLARGSTSKT